MRGAISCALGCPYQGEVSADEVERVVQLMKDIGVDHCGVADTIGVGTPKRVQAVMAELTTNHAVAAARLHAAPEKLHGRDSAEVRYTIQAREGG